MIVCILIPRFELAVAAGGVGELAGRALALAPEPGRGNRIGEVSGAAQALGVQRGMLLGEALARAPALELVGEDPLLVAERWERMLCALEGIGAGVEPQRPGLACFEARGLRGMHGGSDDLVVAAARQALGGPARVGLASTRFCALAAALETRPRRTATVREEPRSFLGPRAVSLLRTRLLTEPLVATLERLGLRTLGEVGRIGAAAMADRFGAAGLEAHRLARGEDDPPRPRVAPEPLHETLELPESASGEHLERALEVLVSRVLAHPERRGRTLRAATLAARLVEGGSWRVAVVFREATADPRRMRLALAPKLALLPAPASSIGLAAERFGPPPARQQALIEQVAAVHRARLREAVAQARAAAGPDAVLRALAIEPSSRVPERRMLLAPFET
jgi:protein ImuB